MSSNTFYYIHDPMCSWCWGFSKTWHQVQKLLTNDINIQYVSGGLAADNHEPMSKQMSDYISNNWRIIERTIPGIKFNYDFWQVCQPKRSIYIACRTVIAVNNQQPKLVKIIIELIQKAYYLQAKTRLKNLL